MSNTSAVSPCCMPGCRDSDGNPRLTRDVICESSRRHYARMLDTVVLHYVLIRRDLPAPASPPGEKVMRVVARVYGHPREWASDMARAIADLLNETHDDLADVLHRQPPPHPGSREAGRVAAAYAFLTANFHELCTYDGAAGVAEAVHDLHRRIRSGLGLTDPRRFLPVPCPQPNCGLLGLVRTLESDGTDRVDCHACGEIIPSDRYAWWTRTLLDETLAEVPAEPMVEAS
jgi:hypothetical protein